MEHSLYNPADARPKVVGSFGSAAELAVSSPAELAGSCDLAEIRLDLLDPGAVSAAAWEHLAGFPLLFTARRREEGGARELNGTERAELLRQGLDAAALVDIEVASIGEMAGVLEEIRERGIPWVASWHDFQELPPLAGLAQAAARAKAAGAHLFKAAARLHSPADIARLAEFQQTDHGIPVATMGMGPLAPVSRLLCAQLGSRLNYGYIGSQPTAPGQWDCGTLKSAIARLAPFP